MMMVVMVGCCVMDAENCHFFFLNEMVVFNSSFKVKHNIRVCKIIG